MILEVVEGVVLGLAALFVVLVLYYVLVRLAIVAYFHAAYSFNRNRSRHNGASAVPVSASQHPRNRPAG